MGVTLVTDTYDMLPMLGRGKHRNPKKGACFMELASYLAGERWSDHPRCTHPLLAMLARAVNDLTVDPERPRLAPLIPSVIGLTSDDPHWDVRIALRAAVTALPIAPADRQQTLAVAIIGAEKMLDVLDDRPAGTLSAESADALASCPRTARWSSGCPTWATPTCGPPRRPAPTPSHRWRSPPSGRRPCGWARPSSRSTPGDRPCSR